jgi:hypothetical protein
VLSLAWAQLVCPTSDSDSFDPKSLFYQVLRVDQGFNDRNEYPSNVGLGVAVSNHWCPTLPVYLSSCLFVDASSIRTHIAGYWSYPILLTVGLRASTPPATVTVYLVDESLASLCQGSQDAFWEGLRGSFRLIPSSARDMWDHRSTDWTPVVLQLTRRRELARGGKQGWGLGWCGRNHIRDHNSYRAELQPEGAINDVLILVHPETVYPALPPENVSSVRARWSDAAYRKSTVTPLMDEFWRNDGTDSYYFTLNVGQLSEVVTYTQHDPVDPLVLLGIYGKWRDGLTRLSIVLGCLMPHCSPSLAAGYWNILLAVFGAVSEPPARWQSPAYIAKAPSTLLRCGVGCRCLARPCGAPGSRPTGWRGAGIAPTTRARARRRAVRGVRVRGRRGMETPGEAGRRRGTWRWG